MMVSIKSKVQFILLLLLPLQADKGYRSDVYSAYINDQMGLWEKTLEVMSSVPVKSDDFLLEIVNYQYGYIGHCLESGKKAEARRYLDLVTSNIEILEKHNYRPGITNAYNAAIYGFRISLNPLSAPFNGPKSLEFIRSAMKLDSEDYFCYIQYGNIKNNMPPAFGGSKQEALEFYIKARNLMEIDPESIKEDWNYMNLLIQIAKTYNDIKDYKSAKSVYENILKLEPGFILVKEDLYPEFLELTRNHR
jgi:tetratricopeptide (TPR) repeat protein